MTLPPATPVALKKEKTMPRKPTTPAEIIDVTANEVAIGEGQTAANQIAVLQGQDAANTKALAAQFNYTGPLDANTLEQLCRAKLALATQSIFEFARSWFCPRLQNRTGWIRAPLPFPA